MTSSLLRIRQYTKENSCHVGGQGDGSFYGDLGEQIKMLIMLLVCAESDKIPLLCKLKQLYKRLPVGFSSCQSIWHIPHNVTVSSKMAAQVLIYGYIQSWWCNCNGCIYCKVFLGTALLNNTPLVIYYKLHAPGGVGQDHALHHFVWRNAK